MRNRPGAQTASDTEACSRPGGVMSAFANRRRRRRSQASTSSGTAPAEIASTTTCAPSGAPRLRAPGRRRRHPRTPHRQRRRPGRRSRRGAPRRDRRPQVPAPLIADGQPSHVALGELDPTPRCPRRRLRPATRRADWRRPTPSRPPRRREEQNVRRGAVDLLSRRHPQIARKSEPRTTTRAPRYLGRHRRRAGREEYRPARKPAPPRARLMKTARRGLHCRAAPSRLGPAGDINHQGESRE
jgi:hypothetical protein